MKPNVTIITLNWNGWQDTIQCLESLYDIDYENYDTILVDNASTDESLTEIDAYCKNELKLVSQITEQIIRDKETKVVCYRHASAEDGAGSSREIARANRALTVIQNDDNYGFAEGNNIAVAYALNELHPDYVLLLNNDTVVDRHFLNELVNAAEHDQQIGLVQPKILTYAATAKNGSNVLGRPAFNDAKDVSEKDEDQNEKKRGDGFFYALAACVLIRNSVLFAFSGECFDPL
ncbi:MAG: glycosyltransferase, partial [Halobacteriota archaeon]